MPETQIPALPYLPLNTGVLFPGMVITIGLETDEAKAAVDAATVGPAHDNLVLLVPKAGERYGRVGTVARVEKMGELPNGSTAIVARGLYRATIGVGVPGTTPALWVQAEEIEEVAASNEALELAAELRAVIEAILEHRGVERLANVIAGADEPGALADSVGYWPDASQELKLETLETLDLEKRVALVLSFGRRVLGELELKDRIRNDVADGMEKTQRDFYLRQQLAAIKKELGEEGDEDLAETFRAKVAGANVPAAVRSAVEKELTKLERTSEQSAEYGWIRNWLETVTELPWGVNSEDNLDLVSARTVLDADHTGLEDVKERILEFLAVRKLRAERNIDPADNGRRTGAILALVGPPGVGKTSLGESIATTLGRKFVRAALGGVHDEAEIRGHRRTYVGAAPGRIVRAFQEAGTMNPVFLLDEIDKVGSDWRGDVSSALLEVLDPAQNHAFKDHYLEVDLDLSDVVFLATANVLDTVPQPLLDRMEIIHLDGYTDEEKVGIGRDHLLVRQLRHAGLHDDEVVITDQALRAIVSNHTREPGVRSLERQIGKVLRKVATKLASGELSAPIIIDEEGVGTYLGRPRFTFEAAERTSVPGVASGLAVTGMGGGVLFIEATTIPNSKGDTHEPHLRLTGQLGDVMKESAEIALSYVRSHADELGVSTESLLKGDVHLHVPAGAIPKDGPSAGVTMTTALVSLLTGRPVRSTVAMTGEVTLRGKVLPIGGVKQKLLAAHRAGMTDVIIPKRNDADLDDVPAAVREQLTVHLAEDVSEVLAIALAA